MADGPGGPGLEQIAASEQGKVPKVSKKVERAERNAARKAEATQQGPKQEQPLAQPGPQAESAGTSKTAPSAEVSSQIKKFQERQAAAQKAARTTETTPAPAGTGTTETSTKTGKPESGSAPDAGTVSANAAETAEDSAIPPHTPALTPFLPVPGTDQEKEALAAQELERKKVGAKVEGEPARTTTAASPAETTPTATGVPPSETRPPAAGEATGQKTGTETAVTPQVAASAEAQAATTGPTTNAAENTQVTQSSAGSTQAAARSAQTEAPAPPPAVAEAAPSPEHQFHPSDRIGQTITERSTGKTYEVIGVPTNKRGSQDYEVKDEKGKIRVLSTQEVEGTQTEKKPAWILGPEPTRQAVQTAETAQAEAPRVEARPSLDPAQTTEAASTPQTPAPTHVERPVLDPTKGQEAAATVPAPTPQAQTEHRPALDPNQPTSATESAPVASATGPKPARPELKPDEVVAPTTPAPAAETAPHASRPATEPLTGTTAEVIEPPITGATAAEVATVFPGGNTEVSDTFVIGSQLTNPDSKDRYQVKSFDGQKYIIVGPDEKEVQRTPAEMERMVSRGWQVGAAAPEPATVAPTPEPTRTEPTPPVHRSEPALSTSRTESTPPGPVPEAPKTGENPIVVGSKITLPSGETYHVTAVGTSPKGEPVYLLKLNPSDAVGINQTQAEITSKLNRTQDAWKLEPTGPGGTAAPAPETATTAPPPPELAPATPPLEPRPIRGTPRPTVIPVQPETPPTRAAEATPVPAPTTPEPARTAPIPEAAPAAATTAPEPTRPAAAPTPAEATPALAPAELHGEYRDSTVGLTYRVDAVDRAENTISLVDERGNRYKENLTNFEANLQKPHWSRVDVPKPPDAASPEPVGPKPAEATPDLTNPLAEGRQLRQRDGGAVFTVLGTNTTKWGELVKLRGPKRETITIKKDRLERTLAHPDGAWSSEPLPAAAEAGKAPEHKDTREEVLASFNSAFEAFAGFPRDRLTPTQQAALEQLTQMKAETLDRGKGYRVTEFTDRAGNTHRDRDYIPVDELMTFLRDRIKSGELSAEDMEKYTAWEAMLHRNSAEYYRGNRKNNLDRKLGRIDAEAQVVGRDPRLTTGSERGDFLEASRRLFRRRELILPTARRTRTTTPPPPGPGGTPPPPEPPTEPPTPPIETGGTPPPPEPPEGPEDPPGPDGPPEPPTPPGEIIREAILANRTSDLEAEARRLASEWVEAQMRINGDNFGEKFVDFFKGFKHRTQVSLFKHGYIQQKTQEIREKMLANNNVFVGLDITRNAVTDANRLRNEEVAAGEATLDNIRMQRQLAREQGRMQEGITLTEAQGTFKNALLSEVIRPMINQGGPVTAEAMQQALREFITRHTNDRTFDAQSLADFQAVFGASNATYGRMAEYFATDIGSLVEKAREDVAAGRYALDQIGDHTRIILANASWAQETRVNYGLVDRAVEWSQRHQRVGKVLNPTVMGAAASVAAFGAARAVGVGGKAANIFAPVVGGVVVGGTFAALREANDLKHQREIHQARRALGQEVPVNASRSEFLEQFQYEMASAEQLINGGGREATAAGDRRSLEQLMSADLSVGQEGNRRDLVRRIAEITMRQDFSRKNGVDLIQFESREKTQLDRLALTKSVIQARRALRQAGMTDQEINDIEREERAKWERQFIRNKDQQDFSFNVHRFGEAAKKGAFAGAIGVGIGIGGKGAIEFLTNNFGGAIRTAEHAVSDVAGKAFSAGKEAAIKYGGSAAKAAGENITKFGGHIADSAKEASARGEAFQEQAQNQPVVNSTQNSGDKPFWTGAEWVMNRAGVSKDKQENIESGWKAVTDATGNILGHLYNRWAVQPAVPGQPYQGQDMMGITPDQLNQMQSTATAFSTEGQQLGSQITQGVQEGTANVTQAAQEAFDQTQPARDEVVQRINETISNVQDNLNRSAEGTKAAVGGLFEDHSPEGDLKRSLSELYKEPGNMQLNDNLTLAVGPDHQASFLNPDGSPVAGPPMHLTEDGKLIVSGNYDQLSDSVKTLTQDWERPTIFDQQIVHDPEVNIHEKIASLAQSGEHKTFLHGDTIIDVNTDKGEMSMNVDPLGDHIGVYGHVKPDGSIDFDRSFAGNAELTDEQWAKVQSTLQNDGWGTNVENAGAHGSNAIEHLLSQNPESLRSQNVVETDNITKTWNSHVLRPDIVSSTGQHTHNELTLHVGKLTRQNLGFNWGQPGSAGQLNFGGELTTGAIDSHLAGVGAQADPELGRLINAAGGLQRQDLVFVVDTTDGHQFMMGLDAQGNAKLPDGLYDPQTGQFKGIHTIAAAVIEKPDHTVLKAGQLFQGTEIPQGSVVHSLTSENFDTGTLPPGPPPVSEILHATAPDAFELSPVDKVEVPIIPIPWVWRTPLEDLRSDIVYYQGEVSPAEREAYARRRSPRLNENPDAVLDAREEARWYFDQQPAEYRQELERMNQSIGEPMSDQCRIAVAIAAASHQEGANIYNTLLQYTDQRDGQGNQIDPNTFEVILFLNRPELNQNGTQVTPDNTAAEVQRFKTEHPEVKVRVIEKVFPGQRPNMGVISKYVADVALLRSMQRTTPANPDLILAMNDADTDLLSKRYIHTLMSEYNDPEKSKIDGALGKIEWNPESYIKHPGFHAANRFYQFLESELRHKPGRSRWVASSGANFTVKSSMYAAIGGYNTSSDLAQDVELGRMIKTARRDDPSVIDYMNAAWVVTSPRRGIDTYLKGNPIIEQWSDWRTNQDTVRTQDWRSRPVRNDESVENLDIQHLQNDINSTFAMYQRLGVSGEDVQKALAYMGLLTKEEMQQRVDNVLSSGAATNSPQMQQLIASLGLAAGDFHMEGTRLVVDKGSYHVVNNAGTRQIVLENITRLQENLRIYRDTHRDRINDLKNEKITGIPTPPRPPAPPPRSPIFTTIDNTIDAARASVAGHARLTTAVNAAAALERGAERAVTASARFGRRVAPPAGRAVRRTAGGGVPGRQGLMNAGAALGRGLQRAGTEAIPALNRLDSAAGRVLTTSGQRMGRRIGQTRQAAAPRVQAIGTRTNEALHQAGTQLRNAGEQARTTAQQVTQSVVERLTPQSLDDQITAERAAITTIQANTALPADERQRRVAEHEATIQRLEQYKANEARLNAPPTPPTPAPAPAPVAPTPAPAAPTTPAPTPGRFETLRNTASGLFTRLRPQSSTVELPPPTPEQRQVTAQLQEMEENFEEDVAGYLADYSSEPFITDGKYVWEQIGYGPNITKDSDHLYRGYLMVETADLPKALWILQKTAIQRKTQGKPTHFKWLMKTVPQGLSTTDALRYFGDKNTVGNYPNIEPGDPRLALYADNPAEILDVLTALAHDPDWNAIETNRNAAFGGPAPRRPGTNAFVEGTREWRSLNFNNRPGYSENEAADPHWREKKIGRHSVQLSAATLPPPPGRRA